MPLVIKLIPSRRVEYLAKVLPPSQYFGCKKKISVLDSKNYVSTCLYFTSFVKDFPWCSKDAKDSNLSGCKVDGTVPPNQFAVQYSASPAQNEAWHCHV